MTETYSALQWARYYYMCIYANLWVCIGSEENETGHLKVAK